LKPLQTRSDILRPLDPGTGSAIEMVTSPILTTDGRRAAAAER
jgi:hypothetical protein